MTRDPIKRIIRTKAIAVQLYRLVEHMSLLMWRRYDRKLETRNARRRFAVVSEIGRRRGTHYKQTSI